MRHLHFIVKPHRQRSMGVLQQFLHHAGDANSCETHTQFLFHPSRIICYLRRESDALVAF